MASQSVMNMGIEEIRDLIRAFDHYAKRHDLWYLSNNPLLIKEVVKVIHNYSLFDENGRYILQRKLDYEECHENVNLKELFPEASRFLLSSLREGYEKLFHCPSENYQLLEKRISKLESFILQDKRVSGLLNGPGYLIFLPPKEVFSRIIDERFHIDNNEVYSKMMSEVIFPIMKKIVESTFGKWKFDFTYLFGARYNIETAKYHRHFRDNMLNSLEPKLAMYFPFAFYRHQFKDAIFAEKILHPNVFLAGPIETSIAFMMYKKSFFGSSMNYHFPCIRMFTGLSRGTGRYSSEKDYLRFWYYNPDPNQRRQDGTTGLIVVEE